MAIIMRSIAVPSGEPAPMGCPGNQPLASDGPDNPHWQSDIHLQAQPVAPRKRARPQVGWGPLLPLLGALAGGGCAKHNAGSHLPGPTPGTVRCDGAFEPGCVS